MGPGVRLDAVLISSYFVGVDTWWWTCALALAGGLDPTLAEVEPLRGSRLATSAPPIPADAYLSAEAGQVATGLVAVDGSSVRKAWGVGIVDVPIEAMWAAINDDRSKPSTTRLAHLEVLDGEPCGAQRTVFQYLPISMASDRWVPFTEGGWLLADLGGGRTLVEYYAGSDPGGSIPAGLASRFAAGGIEDTIAAMAGLARKGPSCSGP